MIDGIDGLAPGTTDEHQQGSGDDARSIAEMTLLIDALRGGIPPPRVVILATTARIVAMDDRLAHRFNHHISWPIPTLQDRLAILAFHGAVWPLTTADWHVRTCSHSERGCEEGDM